MKNNGYIYSIFFFSLYVERSMSLSCPFLSLMSSYEKRGEGEAGRVETCTDLRGISEGEEEWKGRRGRRDFEKE